ncbi:MAG: class I SAM-dependent methyltransferase [Phycisphaerae bacterium]|nr:class I SAM-dependent methyltransferase [Phycisphaerae bacterium]
MDRDSEKSAAAKSADRGREPQGPSRRWAWHVKMTLEWAMEPLALAEDDRVLEVPCGHGEFIERLFNRWPTVEIVGIDESLPSLTQALARNLGSGVYLIQAATGRLPLQAKSLDAAVCTTALHCVSEPAPLLGELYRVIKPGGILLLMDWCHDYPMQRSRELARRVALRPLVGLHSIRGCRALITKAGFAVTLAEQARLSWRWGMMRFLSRRHG